MIVYIITLFMLVLTCCAAACDSKPKSVEISMLRACSPSPEQARFVIECAAAANPKSDEEGEDLVEQCEETSHRLFTKVCSEPLPHYKYHNGEYYDWVLCEGATLGSPEEAACKGLGKPHDKKKSN